MERKSAKHIKYALVLNIILAIIEILGAILTNSVSLLTKSIREIGNVLSISIAYFLERRSQKRPKKEYTYGYARYSILGAIFSSFFLIICSIIVLITIIPRLIKLETINYEGMFWISFLGLVLNGIGVLKTYNGKGLNEQAITLHLFENLLSCFSILIISIIIPIWNIPILDPLLSIIITIFIFKKGLNHLKEALNIFLEKVPDNIAINDLKERIKEVKYVLKILNLHVWTLDGIKDCASLNILVEDNISIETINIIKKQIKKIFKDFHIEDITIEITTKSN